MSLLRRGLQKKVKVVRLVGGLLIILVGFKVLVYEHQNKISSKFMTTKYLYLWRVLKAPPVNPQTYIFRYPKIDHREGR